MRCPAVTHGIAGGNTEAFFNSRRTPLYVYLLFLLASINEHFPAPGNAIEFALAGPKYVCPLSVEQRSL